MLLTMFGKKKQIEPEKKNTLQVISEYIQALFGAVLLAILIRGFVFEPFKIPSESMVPTLLVGDHIFVARYQYGLRVPFTKIWIKEFKDPVRGDVVVFNYPMEDWRPVDKKENYIKRCIAIPGDSLRIIDRAVYINSSLVELPDKGQYRYFVKTNGTGFNRRLLHEMQITEVQTLMSNQGEFVMWLTRENATKIKELKNVIQIEPIIQAKGELDPDVYPFYPAFNWNIDNYGPIYVPQKGDKIELTLENYKTYERVIKEYENNPTLKMKDGVVSIDNQTITHYTFEMDYYWMIGDNRHNSADSRYWGFVPEDHIVGKALFIWMSWDKDGKGFNKIRFNRLFKGIH